MKRGTQRSKLLLLIVEIKREKKKKKSMKFPSSNYLRIIETSKNY